MYKPKQILTPQELEKKQLELKERYNFKYDKEQECFSFEIAGKKAFIINLSNPIHHNKITPYFIRRGKLAEVVDTMYDDIPAEEGMTHSNEFVALTIEILGNMLDENKMGSIDIFVNHVWDTIKRYNNIVDIIDIYSSIIAMFDMAADEQLKDMDRDELRAIHDKFMNEQMRGFKIFAIKPDGQVVNVLGNPEPKSIEEEKEQKYDLRNMTPLNTKWEI